MLLKQAWNVSRALLRLWSDASKVGCLVLLAWLDGEHILDSRTFVGLVYDASRPLMLTSVTVSESSHAACRWDIIMRALIVEHKVCWVGQ